MQPSKQWCFAKPKRGKMMKPTYVADYKAIEHILLNHYAAGNQAADSSLMKPAFHPDATIHSVADSGALDGGNIQILFDTIDNHFKPSANPQVAIAYIDISGTAASARVDTDDLSGYGFSDYFNLLKINGKWQVVSKIFHTHYAP